MRVPFNDTKRTYFKFKAELDAALAEVTASGWWLLGKKSEAFAAAFGQYCNARYCPPLPMERTLWK